MQKEPFTGIYDQLLLTIEETGRRLGVGRSTIYELMRSKQLESVKIGRCTRIPADSIDALVRRLRNAA